MSRDPKDTAEAGPAALTAGGLLRQARQARGLHIAALATSIKVSPHKLELLETDRLDQLPGTAFSRALAQTVCRFLKIDSAPVMALLPPAPGHGLEQMSRGLNEPFRDRPGRRVPNDLQFLKNPVLLGALAMLIAATGIYLIPSHWVSEHLPRAAPTAGAPPAETVGIVTEPVATSDAMPPDPLASASSAAEAASLAASAVPIMLPPVAPAEVVVAADAASAAPAGLQLRAAQASWVEVIDRRGVSLLSRRLKPGETVALDGASPLRVKIGNASATQLSFNGQPVDLAPVTSRGNVARIELR